MLIITGSMRVDPDDLPQFLADFDLLAAETRLRKGSISYDAALADAKAGLFLISERWADQASLDAHLAAADTVAFIDRWSGRMQGDLKKYDASNERYLMEYRTLFRPLVTEGSHPRGRECLPRPWDQRRGT